MRIKYIMIFVSLFFIGCGNGSQTQESDRIDSLLQANKELTEHVSLYKTYIDEVTMEIDSIEIQNGIIISMGREGIRRNRYELKESIRTLGEMLERQKKRIAELESSFSEKNEGYDKLRKLIDYLNAQILEKEQLVSQLRTEIESKNFDINKLKNQVSTLTQDVESLNQKANTQAEELKAQDQIINEGFVIIGSKKELSTKGLLSKSNLFAKKKVSLKDIDLSLFKKVDIRSYNDIKISGKNPKILSQMPTDSYTWNSDTNNMILHITNVTKFWSLSNVLIIQTK